MGLEHEKPRPERLPEPAPRDDVRVAASALRCPFCHESVEPEASDWLACKLCLARHHEGCWVEGRRRCAACGGTHVVGEIGWLFVVPILAAALALCFLALTVAFLRRG